MMYSNHLKMSARYISPLNLGLKISPDITIEFVKSNTEVVNSQEALDSQVTDDDDNDSYFNPLVYCSITMDDDKDEPTCQKDIEKPLTADLTSKMKKITKTTSNENSSSVCNGADSNISSKAKKRFSCHICQKTFGWTTDLKRHILIHTGERPFKCTMCFATFTRNFLLQKHKTKIHQCLSPNEVSQLNNNVAKNLMEIKQKMHELEKARTLEEDDGKEEGKKPKCKKQKKNK